MVGEGAKRMLVGLVDFIQLLLKVCWTARKLFLSLYVWLDNPINIIGFRLHWTKSNFFLKEYSSQANWKALLVRDLSSGSLKLYHYILSLSREVTGNSPLASSLYLPLILPLFEVYVTALKVTVDPLAS